MLRLIEFGLLAVCLLVILALIVTGHRGRSHPPEVRGEDKDPPERPL